jgi:circadian clock protein KaiC
MAEVDRRKPQRLVIDALSEVRMLAKDPLRYRRQILSLKEYAPENCTVMLLDDRSSRYADLELHSIVHGVITMHRVLAGIRERLKELGGLLEIESKPDGTLLRATIPFPSAETKQREAANPVFIHDKAPHALPLD